jgi:hypothetical protein
VKFFGRAQKMHFWTRPNPRLPEQPHREDRKSQSEKNDENHSVIDRCFDLELDLSGGR